MNSMPDASDARREAARKVVEEARALGEARALELEGGEASHLASVALRVFEEEARHV